MTTAAPSEFVTVPCVFFGQVIGEISCLADRGPGQPLLTIGIPTFNRASRLRSLLHSLGPQCAKLAGQVEIVVSDNASTDDTRAVVEAARERFPITYSRNTVNEGACRNVQLLATTLSRGRFTWLLGDDDLVRNDGVERILAVLTRHPEVYFVFANTSPRLAAEYAAHTRDGLVRADDFPVDGPVKARFSEDRLLERFDELIDPAYDDVFLGSLMCGVFRTETWREYQVEIRSRETSFNSLETSYPHALVYAHTMVGRKAYFLSYPVSIAFWGAQEWIARVPRLLLLRLQELLALYEEKGVPHRQIVECRAALVRISGDSLRALLLDPKLPGFDEFDLERFIANNRECADVIFEQLDVIVAEARKRGLDNRHLESAAKLVRLYPSNKPVVAAATPPSATVPLITHVPLPIDTSAFAARVADIEAMLRAGRVEEAAAALQAAKSISPNEACTAHLDGLIEMLRELPPAGTASAPAPTEFFGAEELANLTALISGYAADRGNAQLLGEVRALQRGLAEFLGTADPTQLQSLLAGDFGQVYFRVVALQLGNDPAAPQRDLPSAVNAGFTPIGFDPRPLLCHLLFQSHGSHS